MSDISVPDDASFNEALELLADPHQLLPGEEPETRYPDDARHWLQVYAELLRFKDELLATVRRASRRLRRAGRHEANKDLELMEAERSRLHRRFLFWRHKAVALDDTTPTGEDG